MKCSNYALIFATLQFHKVISSELECRKDDFGMYVPCQHKNGSAFCSDNWSPNSDFCHGIPSGICGKYVQFNNIVLFKSIQKVTILFSTEMTRFERELCTKGLKCNSKNYQICPNGPNEGNYPHTECQDNSDLSKNSFSCLNRRDKYPDMFSRHIFNGTSRSRGINLNTKLAFNEQGFQCQKNFNISWSEYKRLYPRNNNIQNCTLKDGTAIGNEALLRLFYLDFGFHGRQWIPKAFLSM